ncbi:acyltransferase family protein [Dongia deserti]|uniref:acyltransferase family protein n=1 Tax=Dongia deserti TaxID=2268030 RepID=UPI000E6595F6|nr:acyltransferase family protein [Dongia deserti]
MVAALISTGRALHAMVRGDRAALTKEELSRTISFARITLIVGLVFIHYEWFPNARISPFRGFDPTQNHVATFVQSFVLFFFFSVVPLLSMISGWLFLSFTSDPASALISRMRRRFASLYLPLVFWNTLFLAILLVLFVAAPGHPLLSEMNIDFNRAGAMDYVNAVLGISAHPIGFQFWFVRDLFVTVLVSPLLWILLTRAPLFGAVFLGASWLIGHDLWIFFRADVVFFFYLGGWIRLRGVPVEIGVRATTIFLLAYIALCAARTLAPYVVGDGNPFELQVVTRGMRLVGVLACWGLFQRMALTPMGGLVARFGGLAFFLHAAHYPLIAGVKLILWDVLPAETQPWMLAHYVASVIVTVTIGIGLGLVLTRFASKAFSLLNGGRIVA